jgi:hypothetical protein
VPLVDKTFEAENQAAVAAACGLKVQLDLNCLVADAAAESSTTPSDPVEPLFFFICVQGPIHELCAHRRYKTPRIRSFNSMLLASLNALLPDRGEDFIIGVNNIVDWGQGQFRDSVVKCLGTTSRANREAVSY